MATKVSYEEAAQLIVNALPQDGSAIVYNDATAAIEEAGNGGALKHVHALHNAGLVVLSVKAGEAGPVLHIARPQGGE